MVTNHRFFEAVNSCLVTRTPRNPAAAHKLANDHGLSVPSWVWREKYYMKEMYFGNIGKGRLRIYNMLYSPAEFKHRGLFVDENILMRV